MTGSRCGRSTASHAPSPSASFGRDARSEARGHVFLDRLTSPASSSARRVARSLMPARRTVTRGGTELVYWTWPGAGPPTLLLHGIGNYGRYWDLFADAIDGRLQLVAPDARGHGESGRPAGRYAPADFAADALAVLDRLGIERAVVVGHSMGALHSIHLAARHLERTSPGYPGRVYKNRLAFAFREEAGGLVWRSDPAALEQIMSGRMPAEDRWDALASIKCPTLVVRGRRSNVLGEDVARRMAQTLANGRLMELDAGHNVPLDRPRELADAVVVLAT